MDLERIEFDARNRQVEGYSTQFSFTGEGNMLQEKMGNALYAKQLNMIKEDRSMSDDSDMSDDD